jgi:Planctomycete cytochrome C
MKYVFPALSAVLMVSGSLHAADTPSYVKDVKPFLGRYCVACHQGPRAKAGYKFDSYDSLFKGGRRGPAVMASNADKSMLIRSLEGAAKKMPPRKYSEQPSADEIAKLKAWITAGAKDDTDATKDDKPAEKSDKGNGVAFDPDYCTARRE